MPLTTRTFEELRKSNADALEHVHYTPGMEIHRLRKDRRERMQELLEQRQYIEELASVDDQKAVSGIERYGTEVMQLSAIQNDMHFKRLEGQELRNYIWNALPNGLFKRFQELFCREEHLIAPPFHITAKGDVVFDANVRSLSLDLCLISPDLVKDDFAQSTGLCAFTEEDTPLTRLEKKRAAIPKLKAMFSSAQSLQPGHYRFLMLREPRRNVQQESDGTLLKPGIAGTLLYLRRASRNGTNRAKIRKPNTDPLQREIVQHFTSVYGALRKPSHQTNNYDREQLQLTRLQVETEHLHRQCGQWKPATPSTEKQSIRTAGEQVLAQAEELLSRCKDVDKVEAQEAFAKVGPMLARGNTSAAMAALLKAMGKMQHRLITINPISGFNEQDRRVLMRIIATEELEMRTYRKHFAKGTTSLESSKRPGSVSALGVDTATFNRVRLQPLATFAERMQEKQRTLDAALHGKNRDSSARTAVEMHIIGKLQGLRSCVETVKLTLTGNRAVPVEDIAALLSQFMPYFATRQVLPAVTVPPYEKAFESLRTSFSAIQKRLKFYVEEHLDLPPREEMYGRLKDYLDTFDIEAIVQELP